MMERRMKKGNQNFKVAKVKRKTPVGEQNLHAEAQRRRGGAEKTGVSRA